MQNAVAVSHNTLDNGIISVTVDDMNGAVKSISNHSINNDFADAANGKYLNEYLFLPGNNLADIKKIDAVTIAVKESGPVLSSLRITSNAAGCNSLTREIQLVKGFDFVEITNILDKKRAELNPNPGEAGWANTGGKESVNFGFPFNVKEGAVKLDIPLGQMRPETDQIPGSCKNWLSVGGWADVSNTEYGITWATLDAPLVEVGGITATMLGGQTNPAVWRKKIEPTQTLYSWALNNHWETNSRAYQEGLIRFRYALQPHAAFNAVKATAFATGLSQPLVVAKADDKNLSASLLQLSSKNIVVLVLKPSEDGKAWIVTLYNPADQISKTNLQWGVPVKATHYSNTGESILEPAPAEIAVGPLELVTLRVEK